MGNEYRLNQSGKPMGSSQPKDHFGNYVMYNSDGMELEGDKYGYPVTYNKKKEKIVKD